MAAKGYPPSLRFFLAKSKRTSKGNPISSQRSPNTAAAATMKGCQCSAASLKEIGTTLRNRFRHRHYTEQSSLFFVSDEN